MAVSDSQIPRLQRAAQRRPNVGASVEELAQYLDGHGAEVERMDDARLDDAYLACACARGDRAAVEEFTRDYRDEIRRVVGRLARGPALEELVHRVLAHLLVRRTSEAPRIGGFTGAGALKGFVRMAASRFAIDVLRAGAEPSPEPPEAIEEAMVDQANALELLEQEQTRERLTQALGSALRTLKPVERRALRMRYLLGFSVSRTATALGVHEVTVSRLVARARERTLSQLQSLPDLPGGPAALAALAQTLEVSVSRYLESHPGVGSDSDT